MRKVYISIVSIVLLALTNAICNPAVAGTIDEKTARKAGSYFLAAQFGTKAINTNTVQLIYTIQNTTLNVPAIYFYNTPLGGYVMVAGTDCIDPIIGYSDEGQFDTSSIPPQMLWFLNGYVQPIVAMQNSKATPTAQTQELWDQLLEERLPYFGSQKTVTRLTNSIWSQDYPYNSMVPSWNNQACPTGCVATAMAQILYYWKYPYKGAGSLSYTPPTHTALGTQTANFGTSYYNYNLMGNDMSATTSQDSVNAVGLLNYHCGISVHMDYDPEGSGAYPQQYLKYALNTYFKYRNTINMINRSKAPFANTTGTPSAADTLWCDTIRTEILAKRPVFYTGTDESSSGADAAHAFICDGYNSMNKLFRFNWGWGYMNSSCFCNVYTSALSAYGYTFASQHTAYLGVQPPQDTLDARRVSINEVENAAVLPAYPNPATGEVHLPYQLNETSGILQIYSTDGRLIESKTVYGGNSEVVLDITKYPHGVYVYRVNSATRKFVVK
jgi:hypothetical protein